MFDQNGCTETDLVLFCPEDASSHYTLISDVQVTHGYVHQ